MGAKRICFPFVGDVVGGSHISAVGLLTRLPREQYEPLILLHRPDGAVAALLREVGLPFETTPPIPVPSAYDKPFTTLRRLVAATGTLRRFLRERAVDLVHTNDAAMHVTWGLAARCAGIPQLWHHRGDPEAVAVRYLAPWTAARVVGVSRFALPTRTYPSIAHRSSVIRSPFEHPPRFDAPAAAAALRQELGVGPETRILAYAGIFVDRKRPVLFVDIVKTLLDRHPAMPVMGVLFGEVTPDTADVHRQVLERARSLGIADRIRPMGFRRPLYPWLAATDILVVPAVNEPFGRTLIEAMMLGTPVVAARSGGNIEAIVDGENGFLVAPDDPTAFVLPLARLISEPALYGRIAATAKKRALGTFSDETHVREIVALYKDILQARAGARPSGHNNRMTAT